MQHAVLSYETRLFIDGEFVTSKSGAVFPTVNPATEQVRGTLAPPPPRTPVSLLPNLQRSAPHSPQPPDTFAPHRHVSPCRPAATCTDDVPLQPSRHTLTAHPTPIPRTPTFLAITAIAPATLAVKSTTLPTVSRRMTLLPAPAGHLQRLRGQGGGHPSSNHPPTSPTHHGLFVACQRSDLYPRVTGGSPPALLSHILEYRGTSLRRNAHPTRTTIGP